MKLLSFFLLAVIALVSAVGAQETFEHPIPEPGKPPLAPENPEEPPRQFRTLALGMPFDGLKSALKADSLFHFRDSMDVSYLPAREETLVETTGLSFIRRAYFQLSDGLVYIMSFSLDTRLTDHYSVFTSFIKKYGEPDVFNPEEAVWENESTRVSIERPLTVKYLDKTVFNRLVAESEAKDNGRLLEREEFLAEF